MLFLFPCFQASRLHRLYDREVVELDENVSFIIVFPPPEEVCSAPGQLDCLSHQKSFITMSVQTFEMSKIPLLSNFLDRYLFTVKLPKLE